MAFGSGPLPTWQNRLLLSRIKSTETLGAGSVSAVLPKNTAQCFNKETCRILCRQAELPAFRYFTPKRRIYEVR